MTTFAPHDSALEERTRQAWSAYRDDLADRSGRDYDDAEAEAWDRLQDVLTTIEADRAASHSGGENRG
jgi:predicted phage gp36 major capsid-like protein